MQQRANPRFARPRFSGTAPQSAIFIAIALASGANFSHFAYAARSTETPQALEQIRPPQTPKDTLACERKFSYQGKLLNCDSYRDWDGETLRPIISNTPEAIRELDSYQKNRRTSQLSAYSGTLGLLVLLASSFVSPGGAKNILISSGVLITGGSFFFGSAALQANEDHLENAVRIYNHANPANRVELQFQTGVSF